jgi:hypothetical protein
MDLSHVFGFPTWEKEVFTLFEASFAELSSVFDYYAKSGTAGSSSAGTAMTMQQTELQNLALDCGLSNEQFSMTRVINIFKRADQVDDTFVASKANKNVILGQTAKGGDRGLQLHEFFECLVMLALQKANPKFGSVGHNTSVEFPLPGCLAALLTNSLLKNAKRDKLALVKAIEGSPFFNTVRGQCITSLYNNDMAFTVFGYPGASWEKGGYLTRGFQDLKWLRPPTAEASPPAW